MCTEEKMSPQENVAGSCVFSFLRLDTRVIKKVSALSLLSAEGTRQHGDSWQH
jgi:hypothetical protein